MHLLVDGWIYYYMHLLTAWYNATLRPCTGAIKGRKGMQCCLKRCVIYDRIKWRKTSFFFRSAIKVSISGCLNAQLSSLPPWREITCLMLLQQSGMFSVTLHTMADSCTAKDMGKFLSSATLIRITCPISYTVKLEANKSNCQIECLV